MLYALSFLAMIGLIIFFHLDNLKFCKKLDKIQRCLNEKKPIPAWDKL